MKRIALALAAWFAIAAPALAQQQSGALTGLASANAASAGVADFSPARNLSNLIGKTSAVICAIGDSTMTVGPTAGFSPDPLQTIWGTLQAKLMADNPQITSWNWGGNYAIAASNEANPVVATLAGTGLTLPSWAGAGSSSWLTYVQTGAATGGAPCDVLFWLFGTNAATSGQSAGSSAATFIRENFEVINGWSEVPNVIIITNKSANPTNDIGGDDANQSAHKAQAAFHRTFARSNAAGYTSFPNVSALGFGLIDLGRNFTARITEEAHDPDAQKLKVVPSCVVNGVALGTASIIGTNASTVCLTKHGDFRLTLVLPASGGATLYNFGGSHALQISASEWASNYVRLAIGSLGAITPSYVLDGSISNPPLQTGTPVSTTSGQDVTITVSMVSSRVQVTINGTLALDIMAPRFISETAGGMPVNLNFPSAPTGSPTANITEFWQGIGAPTNAAMNYATAYGPGPGVTACGFTDVGCESGNGDNHQRTGSLVLDREVIQSLNFHVPAVATASSAGLAKAGAGLNVAADGTLSTVVSTGGVALSRDPTATDDNTQGYSAGEIWENTSTGDSFVARSVATSAAVWLKREPTGHPGYIASRYYLPVGYGTTATTSAASGGNLIVCSFGSVKQRMTLSALALSVTTTDSGKLYSMGLYSNGTWSRPASLLANTSDITMSGSTGSFTGSVSVQIDAGNYWFCANTTSTSAVFRALSASSNLVPVAFTGAASVTNAVGSAVAAGVSIAQTYGTWPSSFTSGTSWSDVVTSIAPIVGFDVASVP